MHNDHRPSATFLNLDPAKRELIIREAVAEFARQGYKGASLNTIVRQAGIAKGSLYQYFSNKEALFFYLFTCFVDLVKESVRDAGGSGDFFERIRDVLWAGVSFIRNHPRYFQFYLKVHGGADVPGRKELLARVRFFSREYFGPLCQEGRDEGIIRSDVTPEMAVFIVDAVLDRFLKDFAALYFEEEPGPFVEAGLQSDVDMVIKVLRQGLAQAN